MHLRAGATVLEFDLHGEKVLQCADQTFLKLFRRKRWLSSAAWNPYARRFADNSRRLAGLGIPCPQVIAVFRVPDLARDVVHYHPLPGKTIRQLIGTGLGDVDAIELRRQLGRFIASLHRRGIYFRSLHLGNIVLTPAGTLGLIDVADMSIHQRRLGGFATRRNMQHLLRYAADAEWLMVDGEFSSAYTVA